MTDRNPNHGLMDDLRSRIVVVSPPPKTLSVPAGWEAVVVDREWGLIAIFAHREEAEQYRIDLVMRLYLEQWNIEKTQMETAVKPA
jgi:hypothetical protein